MNVSRFVTGVILLAVGVLLSVLTFVLPPNEMIFMIGDANLPIVPAALLGGVGIWLIATSAQSEKAPEPKKEEIVSDPAKIALNRRLESIGWGLFLIMLGGFMLVPHELVDRGFWSIGVGLIMLGLNGARYYSGLKMSGFTTFLGTLALLTGLAELLGYTSLDGALFLIILGAYLLVKPWFDQRQLFGKVQEG